MRGLSVARRCSTNRVAFAACAVESGNLIGEVFLRLTRPPSNGITSRLVLLYVERTVGAFAVDDVVERAGLAGRKEQLLDENYWFSYDEKIALFEAAAEVLEDENFMRRVGEFAMDMNVGQGLKMALRALGSPRLVYQNIVRANAKFSGAHKMTLLDIGSELAVIRYSDLTDQHRYHPLDCQYNQTMLATIPEIFGLPRAQIRHLACGCEGDEACVYEIRWDQGLNATRAAVAGGAASVGAVALAAIFAPALLPIAFALPVAIAAWIVFRYVRASGDRTERLQREVSDQARIFERLSESLQDLVSELRLEDVLSKVAANAHLALPGREFVLLLSEGEGPYRCQTTANVSTLARGRLETWAGELPEDMSEPITVDDLHSSRTLAPLTEAEGGHFCSLCAAPLTFRDRMLGILVSLDPSAHSFLPSDVDVIRSYAAQAAIGIANARLYEAAEEMASRDHLTGLLNHREFHEAMERELARARRDGDRFSVVLFDLDDFKQVNDARGHAHGDRVLSQVGGALAGTCRSSDLAFRVGGDELALLLPETDQDEAKAAAERACDALTSVADVDGASYGITTWPRDAESKDDLIASADGRLYEMKRTRAGLSSAPPAGEV
jgi:diguanylate cyclase (GGDEF)-like protein